MAVSLMNVGDDLRRTNWHVQALERNYRAFVDEAFIFLLDHFGYQSGPQRDFTYFTPEMGKAILTIGYVFRRRLRTYFRNARINIDNINEFQRLAEHFKLIRDECYYFRIMTRLSHIFELSMYCLEKGYDYTTTARIIAATDDSVVFFNTNGGFARLKETASFIAEVGEIFKTVIKEEKPKVTGLKSFVSAAECVENSNCPTLTPNERNMTGLLKRCVISKLKDISALDPRISKVFYNMICQHFSKVYTLSSFRFSLSRDSTDMELNIRNEKTAIIELFDMLVIVMVGETQDICSDSSTNIQLAKYFAIFRHLTDLVSTELDKDQVNPESTPEGGSQFERNINNPNKYFIISEDDMLDKKNMLMTSDQQGPSTSADDNDLTNAWKVLDSNIAANNYFQLNDGRYVVYTPECKFQDDTTTINVTQIPWGRL